MTVSINGSTGLVFNDGSSQATAAKTGMINRIINGAMVIDQRNAGASVALTASNVYNLDRWYARAATGSGHTAIRSTTAPTGFINSLLITIGTGASPGATDNNYVAQRIEGLNVSDLGWGTANAATVTLSFVVRSSVTGTFGGAVQNSDLTRSYPFTYTISAANTFETKTVTIPGDTTGTWLTTNGIGATLTFDLGTGSTFQGTAGAWAAADFRAASGTTKLVANSGATFYITGVQLEKGSTATSFDYRPFGTELILCRRYFTKYYQNTTGAIGDTGVFNMAMWAVNSAYTAHWFQVSMRTGPSFSYSANSDFTLYSNGATRTPSNITQQGSSADRCEITVDIATSLTSGNSSWLRITGTNGFIAWSAEL